MKRLINKHIGALVLMSAAASLAAAQNAMPGKGVAVTPVKSSIQEETFQTRIVGQALKDLGYDVSPIKEVEYATALVALANGDATYMADFWDPLHADFYKNAGGDGKLWRKGVYSTNALQGYLIDKATADKHKITNLGQLKDPKIAKLFDTDGDGKADLAGCVPGWGCEKVIEHQLTAFKLRDTVTHKQGAYAALIADVIARKKAGQPVLYYTWTPYWVSGVLVPGKDVVWLEVPFSSQPGENKNVSTKLPNGKDYGLQVNNQLVVAN
jgi:glycine betaine/proline transport system substrate-binding protein